VNSLTGLTIAALEKLLSPLPRFRASQIYKWIIRGIDSFDRMTDLPSVLREELKARFSVYSSAVDSVLTDKSACKTVLSLKDGAKIEAVLLSDSKSRLTACLSTQAGCPALCVFCKTGSLGFSRNLDCGEIVEQFLYLQKTAAANSEPGSEHIIEHIVIMGMGEPLLNLGELRKAIAVFTDKSGFNFSRRRITVSTCGICAGLFDLAQNGPYVRLALSLTTADEPLRQKLMPITAANPLAKVKEALIAYQEKSGSRVTLEVPLLGGINTREKDALSIAAFAQGMDSVINLIPWNPVAGLAFEGKALREPESGEVKNFTSLLEKEGLKVTLRHRKGRRVCGACGQLGQLAISNEQ
jgi:23S rRNA (adenine2503-C2)-methyltransferase